MGAQNFNCTHTLNKMLGFQLEFLHFWMKIIQQVKYLPIA